MVLSGTAEGNDDDLRPGPDAEWEGTADACGHVENTGSGRVPRRLPVHPVPLAVHPAGGRETPDAELHGVGMAGKGQLNIGVPQDFQAPMARVMAQENLKGRGRTHGIRTGKTDSSGIRREKHREKNTGGTP